MKNENRGLLHGIAPDKPEHHEPTEKNFKPWHKPRKQWTRSEQLLKETEKLFNELNLSERSMKYLSLPGEDMLDIRILSRLCEKKGIELTCLGFDDSIRSRSEQTEIHISRNEISNMVKESSVITSDDFSALENEKSQAFNYIKQLGPFDVINLDFCSSIFNKKRISIHGALLNLCNFQIQNRKEPWILFITTRSDPDSIKDEDLHSYWHNINHNATISKEFKDCVEGVIGNLFKPDGPGFRLDDSLIMSLTNGNFSKLFGIGVGKWFLRVMIQDAPYWPVNMLRSCCYRIYQKTDDLIDPDMLSLAFKFSPHPEVKKDPSGLVSVKKPENPSETDLAINIIKQVKSWIDLDELVYSDKELFDQLLLDSKQLLKEARYSVLEYEEWAREQMIIFPSSDIQ